MNLIQPLLNSFPPQTWGALAGKLNESPDRTRQGLADALPMFFASMIGKASTAAGAAGLLSMMRNSHIDLDRVTTGREAAVTEPSVLREGGAIAHTVMGDAYNAAANAISRHAGVGLTAAQSLLGLAAPLALGGVARAAPAGGFTPEGLMRFLQGQRDDVLAAAPQGLSLHVDRPAASARPAAAPPARSANRILPWLIGIGMAVLLALVLGQFMSRTPAPAPRAEAPKIVTPPPQNDTITLPGGIRLDVPIGSMGYSLANYLASAEPVPRTFAFGSTLSFESGEVVLSPEGAATLDAIATTLNAYPNVTVRLDGHTDAVGDRATNVSLSLDRANAVARLLSERGVDPARMITAGFGPDRPVASNDTESDRAQNRRIEMTVTRK